MSETKLFERRMFDEIYEKNISDYYFIEKCILLLSEILNPVDPNQYDSSMSSHDKEQKYNPYSIYKEYESGKTIANHEELMKIPIEMLNIFFGLAHLKNNDNPIIQKYVNEKQYISHNFLNENEKKQIEDAFKSIGIF